MPKRLAVIISQGQSHNPAKRKLEEELVAALLLETGIDVTVIPHLYDLKPDGTGLLALQGIAGDMVVVSWLYDRAARWILDRNNVEGHAGEVLLKLDQGEDEDEDDDIDDPSDDEADEADADEGKLRVIDEREIPRRKIYCLDFRASNSANDFVGEVKRIHAESGTDVVQLMDWVGGTPSPGQVDRFLNPSNDTALGPGNGDAKSNGNGRASSAEKSAVHRIEEEPARRWYPVIDFSRCTNCMECIDFCLFGVYGVDGSETILVEQPDNCRKGCPACSRVCPENAIIFPQHKTPAIAGAPVAAEGLKIDLSKLFGAPEDGKSAIEIASIERDEQLIQAGRDAVGMSVGIPKRQENKSDEPKDDLDGLLDELDEMDL